MRDADKGGKMGKNVDENMGARSVRNNRIVGVAYMMMGAGCLVFALMTDTPFKSLLFGLAGAGLSAGLTMVSVRSTGVRLALGGIRQAALR